MASTYENDLRLQEIGTGEQSGTWGVTTNTNLELVAEALSYSGTGEAVANASTHTITMANGVADEARCLYLKCTGGGQACTVTLAPSSLSKVWMVENQTSYTLTFKQGSDDAGDKVAVLTGQVKMIATDGAGGTNGAVFDLMQDLAVPDLFVDNDLTLQSDGAVLGFGENKDVTFTHVHNTGLLLNDAMKVQFRDAAIFIGSSGADVLDIASDGVINLTATDDVVIPVNVGLTFATAEKIESDGTDLSITVGSGGDINIQANIGLTFGDDGEKIESDGTDLTITSGAKINLAATTDVHLANNIGMVFGDAGENIEGDGTNLAINSSGDVNITATTVDLDGDLEVSGTITLGSGAVINETDLEKLDDITNGTVAANKALVVDGDKKLNELLVDDVTIDGKVITMLGSTSDTVVLTAAANGAFSLVTTDDAAAAANIQITADGTAELAGTTVTLDSSGTIALEATSDVIIPVNVGLHFTDADEKIESDGTDLTINSGAKINLTATSDVHIPVNIGLVFGDGGEHIETDNTNLTITSGANVVVAATLLDVNGNLDVSGTITLGSGAVIDETDLEKLDDITNGTVAANKAVVVDGNKDVSSFRNLTATGELDAATGDFSGLVDVAGVLTVSNTTASTSSTTGSLIVGGGAGIADDLYVGTDLDVTGNTVLDGTLDVGDVATATTFEPDGDTAAGDNAAIGYTAAEGLILTGQGSTSDITFKNDADTIVFSIPTGTDDILFPDSAKAMFGAGSDLQIYHDGSNSIIHDNGTGDLILKANSFKLWNNTSSEALIVADVDGAVNLYHDGSTKLATTATGVSVTGNVIATGAVEPAGDTAAGDNAAIGYTAAEGLILTGQGSTGDVTIKNDADAIVAQVPTGTTDISFTGKATANELDLTAIATDIDDTAVDVFVYDTAKDSDGGAWRKRTQHTSWYNEAASATRSSRKEFPSVAVIVAEAATVTIYDGDDPDMPMWMVFQSSGSSYASKFLPRSAVALKAVSMVNGLLAVGGNAGSDYHDAFVEISFLKDSAFFRSTSLIGSFNGGVSARNNTSLTNTTGSYIVSTTVNDVAMTVLPNAPIDAATGLPVPTIAVGTAGGTSIIRDDGTVVDYTLGSYPTKNVEFDFDNNVLQSSRNIGSSGGALYVNKYPIISADSNSGTIQQELVLSSTAGDNTGGLDFVKTSFIEGTKNLVALKDSTLAFSSDAGAVQGIGVYQLGPEGTTKTTTLGAVITSSYNTGWMNGDIKLATLSDTSTTNVTQGDQSTDAEDVGCGLISNGNFTDDVDDWTNDTGTASYYSTDSSMKIVQGSGTGFVYQGITTVVGKTYTLSFSAKGGNTNDVAFYIGTTTTGGTIISQSGITVSSSSYTPITGTFVATATTTYIRVSPWASATNFAYFDNISVRLAEDDRSVNANGLQVFGTVTKSIVATGADLVAYTGWSASNYLMQPYNADLDFGTGDCSLIFWADTPASGSDRIWFSHGTYNTAGSGFNNVQINSSGDGDTTNFNIGVSSAGTIAVGGIEGLGWQCWVLLRRNGIFQVYKNNVLQGSVANVTDIDLSSATINQLYVGTGYTTSVFGTGAGSLALWRMSATAPSPEQIAKIYEDEKFLFQAGAQSTLYDDTDAVTALAYDDATDLLHVGTADGRSTFQGLRRVANTTAAVSVAISASNGLVVED